MGLIWKLRLEPYRTGGLQDLIVDECELALIELDLAVLAVRKNRELRVALVLLNFRQVRLRQRKNDRNRLDLRDDDEAVDVGWMNDIAHVDLTDAGDAIERRRQTRVAELYVGSVDERLIGLDGILQLRDLRFLGVEKLRRSPALLLERRVAIEIGERICELGLIAIPIRGQLFDLSLVGTRIDLSQEVAGMHGLSFGEVDAGDLSLNLAVNNRGVVGDDGADAGQIDRYVVLGDHSGDNRYR